MQGSLTRFFGRFSKRPTCLPASHQNYNFEQFSSYSQRYQKALAQKELCLRKLDTKTPRNKKSQITRDTNRSIENYQAWRTFNQVPDYGRDSNLHGLPHGKIRTTPLLLMRAFGRYCPAPSFFPRATGCLQFEDRNLDVFYIYDAREHLSQLRKVKSDLDIAREFWNSKEEHEFWFSCSHYSEKHRFKKFILTQIEKVKNGEEKSFEEKMSAEFGEFELFNDFNKDYQLRTVPLVYRHHRKEFSEIGKDNLAFIEDKAYDEPLEMPEILADQEGVKKY